MEMEIKGPPERIFIDLCDQWDFKSLMDYNHHRGLKDYMDSKATKD